MEVPVGLALDELLVHEHRLAIHLRRARGEPSGEVGLLLSHYAPVEPLPGVLVPQDARSCP